MKLILKRFSFSRIIITIILLTFGIIFFSPFHTEALLSFPDKIDTLQERKNIQTVLNTVMVPSPNLTVDGVLGRKTIQTIQAFQASQGLEADGKIGPMTRSALVSAQGGSTTYTTTTTTTQSSTPGCSSGAVFNTLTGQRCTSTPTVTTTSSIPGCTTGALFSTINGQRCTGTTTTLPAGCTGSNKFSTISGVSCTSTTTTTTTVKKGGGGGGGSSSPTVATCSGSTTASCTISNGTGSQSRTCTDGNWSGFGTCTVTSCNSGYTQSGNTCVVTVVADTTAPTVTAFTIPTTASSLTVSVSSFTATDNNTVTGYLLTETSSAPASGAAGWTSSAPSTYTFSTQGSKTLYAWAKDAAGNVSTSVTDTITVTIAVADTTAPTVTAFTIPTTASSLTVSVSSFVATDAVGVTGYLLTETSSTPSASSGSWTLSAPSSYTFSSQGSKTLYAWAKDAAGNVSTSASDTTTITVAVVSGITYYVSNTGNNANNGTSEATPWQTIARVNTATFQPGDSVLFPTDATLTIAETGTSDNWITYGAYGTGEKPRIVGSRQVTGWTASGTPNVWQATFAYTSPRQLSGAYYWAEITFENTDGTDVWGTYKADIASLTTEYDWTDDASSHLFVYATSDPDTRYESIEAPQSERAIAFNTAATYDAYSKYIAFDNLDVRYTYRQGLWEYALPYESGTNITPRGLRVTNSFFGFVGHRGTPAGYCVAVLHSDATFQYNTFKNCGRRSLSYNTYNDEADYALIQNVTIDHNHFSYGWHTTGIDISTDNTIGHVFTNFTISNNVFDDTSRLSQSASITSNSVYVESKNSRFSDFYIYNNVVLNPVTMAFNLQKLDNLYFYYNTVYGLHPDALPYQVTVFHDITNIDLRNNIFYGTSSRRVGATDDGIALVQDNYNYSYTNRDYNLYYNDNPAQLIVARWNYPPNFFIDISEWSSFVQTYQHEVHSPTPQDPLFVDTSSGNLRLQSNSPAKNAGTPIAGITTDIEGNTRDATHPSMGAYESGSVLGESAYNFTQKLQLGSKGNEVKELQKILISNGYLKATPDGSFGSLTLKAVKEYQKANGLTPDGVVGLKTREKLNK